MKSSGPVVLAVPKLLAGRIMRIESSWKYPPGIFPTAGVGGIFYFAQKTRAIVWRSEIESQARNNANTRWYCSNVRRTKGRGLDG